MERESLLITQTPLAVIGLGHYGRRLLWVLENLQQEAGTASCVLCPPRLDGDLDETALELAESAAAALVVADGREEKTAARLYEAARILAARGLVAYAILAVPADLETGARWAGDFAGSLLMPYATADEWRMVRAQMPVLIHTWAMQDADMGLPDWRPICAEADRDGVAAPQPACAHAA